MFFAALMGLLASAQPACFMSLCSIDRELPALAWNDMLEAGCTEVYADDSIDNQQECASGWYHWAHEHLMYGEPCDGQWVKRTQQPACKKALVVGIRKLREQGTEGFEAAEALVRAACRQAVLCAE